MSILQLLWAQTCHSESILMPAAVWIAIPALDNCRLAFSE